MGDHTKPTWSSKRYYEVGLITITLGLSSNLYLFRTIRKVRTLFVIPYLISTIFLGIPMTILELSLSQYGKKDLIEIWALCPIFKGLGFTCFTYLVTGAVEDINVLTLIVRYILNSFSKKTGWDSCNNLWNTEFCYTPETNISRRLECYATMGRTKCDEANWESSYQQYWTLIIQNSEFGGSQLKSMIYSLGLTITAFALSCKGLVVLEKVIYWFLILAAIELLLLLYCSFIQQGSGLGIFSFFSWKWSGIEETSTWIYSFKHFLLSTGVGTGALKTLGAQNKFRGHSYMNGMMLILVNLTVTTMYVLLFVSLSGNLSYHTNQPIWTIFEDLEHSLWSKIPRMIEKLSGPTRFWQWCFYSQIFLVVFSKFLMIMFVINQTILNLIPRTRKYNIATTFCLFLFNYIVSLPFSLSYGDFIWKQWLEKAIRGPVIMIMNVLQLSVIIYIYGLTTAIDDMHFMMGFRWPFYWQVILFFTPIIIFSIWLLSLIDLYGFDYNTLYDDLNLAKLILLYITPFVPIIITVMYMLWYTKSMIRRCKWENVTKPSDEWYLVDPVLRKSRQMFSAMSMTKEYLYRQTKKLTIASTMYDEGKVETV